MQQRFVIEALEALQVARKSPTVKGSGERFFDASMRGGSGILSRYVLLVSKSAKPVELEAAGRFAKDFSDFVELRQGAKSGILLVRPDGHIACAPRGSIRHRVRVVRKVLQEQVIGRR